MHVPMMRQTAEKSKFKPLYTLITLSQAFFTGAEDHGIFFRLYRNNLRSIYAAKDNQASNILLVHK